MWSFFKNHGYVWDTGLAGHLTYAPQGKLVKNNLENFLRKQFTFHYFEEVETPLIFRQEVWEQSGHWQKFQDPMVKTQKDRRFRIDKLLEEADPTLDYASLTPEEICQRLHTLNTARPADDQLLVPTNGEIEYQSLMMRTQSGHQMAGLRPETATATYFHFAELLNRQGGKFPIQVFQIGKSFRNEISPKHNLIRGREFTQGEFQVILPPTNKDLVPPTLEPLLDLELRVLQAQKTPDEQIITLKARDLPATKTSGRYYAALIALTYQCFQRLGLPAERLRLRQHTEKEMAFYALDAWDLEVQLKDLGWTEVAGLHDRGGYDLRHLKDSENPNLEHTALPDPPHILEIAIGLDRLFYAVLESLYEEKDASEGKSMWKIPYFLSTIQVSVLPLVKNKLPIVQKAREVYELLRPNFTTEYQEKQSIGKRYLKNAQRGIPYSLTIDFQTLEDETVTVRDRDTEAQVRVAIPDLPSYLFQAFQRL